MALEIADLPMNSMVIRFLFTRPGHFSQSNPSPTVDFLSHPSQAWSIKESSATHVKDDENVYVSTKCGETGKIRDQFFGVSMECHGIISG
jgi:hypothetical protein